MKISDSITLTIDGYPMGSFDSDLSLTLFDGEGNGYHFDKKSKDITKTIIIDPIGFSDIHEYSEFSLLTSLNGRKIKFSHGLTEKIPLSCKFACDWDGSLYFISVEEGEHRLFYWNRERGEAERIDIFKNQSEGQGFEKENIVWLWPCGNSLFVMCETQWFLMSKKGELELLTREVLPFSTCHYLEKNQTFHFILPGAEAAFVSLDPTKAGPYITQAKAHQLRIIGARKDRLALQSIEQLLYLKAVSDKHDEYKTIPINNLRTSPMLVKIHPQENLLLVQEEPTIAALWEAVEDSHGEGICHWREEFDHKICYMKMNNDMMIIGLENGEFILKFLNS